MHQNGPKPKAVAQTAIALHTFGVPVININNGCDFYDNHYDYHWQVL